MKKLMSLTWLLMAFCFYVPLTQAQNPEAVAARVPLENYLKGHATGQGDYIRKAFHPDARLQWFRDGKYQTRSLEDFIAGFKGEPAPDESQRKRRIESLDIAGNAGTAKIVLDYPSVKFVDYMSLLKIGDEWKIVNKIFYAEYKPKP
ncbi:MAG: nuclear transport factor 2 family protein [Acidobacteriota bacterium]